MRLKSNPKRIISLALAGCMAVSMVPASAVTAFAAETGTGSSVTAPATVKVEVTLDGTQTLEQAVKAKNQDLASITELKVITTGSAALTKADFQFMSGIQVTGDGVNASQCITKLNGAAYLSNLKTIDLQNTICEENTIPIRAFCSNSTIEKVVLPNTLQIIGLGAFGSMSNLSYVGTNVNGKAGDSIDFPDTLTTIGFCSFYGDKKLTGNVKLPDKAIEMGSAAFAQSGITGTIKIGNNISWQPSPKAEENYINTDVFAGTGITEFETDGTVAEVPTRAMHNCNLTSIKISESIKTIEKAAFRHDTLGNNKFTEPIVIPKNVETLGESAFTHVGIVDSIIVENPNISIGAYCFSELNDGVKIYLEKLPEKDGVTRWTSDKTVVLNTNGGTIDTTKDVDKTTGLYTPEKEGYTFAGWYDADGKELTKTAAKNNTYTAKWTQNASMDANADKKDDSQNATVTVGKPVEITVTVNPGDHMAEIWNGKAKITFTDPSAVESLSCNGKTYTGKELADADYTLSVSDLMQSSSVASYATSETAKMSVVFNKKGNQTVTIQLLDSKDNLLCESTTAVVVEEEKKPEETKPDDTKKDDDGKKDDPKPENPVTTYALTVADGTVKVNGKDAAANESGAYAVEKDAKVEVTFDKTTLSDAQVFDQWTITPASVLNEVDPKSETISFTMPAEEVSIKAMTRDATIEDDGPGVLGTAAMIGVGVAGTAVLGYQGYMIGTELYLNSVLPAGAAIPNNATELALLVWNDAGKPAPAAVLAADATDEQKALTWAIENQLISADKAADASVTRWEVIQTWNKEQEMKKA